MMKGTIEVDCTPEEARRFMGLPDVTPNHEITLDHMKRGADNAAPFVNPENLAKAWLPMTGMAMEQFQQAFWTAAGVSSTNPGRKKDK